MKRYSFSIFLLALSIAVFTGCASGDNPIQTSPGSLPALSDIADHEGAGSCKGLWGMWSIEFNPESGIFEITPIRGAMFQANITRFLQPPSSPINLLSIELDMGSSNLPEGYVVCDITLQHPFVGLPRFRGFDVMGIVMGDASFVGLYGDLLPTLDELRILNADGYTRWWNPTEFTTYDTIFGYTHGAKAPGSWYATGTVNGFKYFADDLDVDESFCDLDLETRGTFSVDPGINSRRYEIQFPMPGGSPDFHFNYAITASYNGPMSDDDPEFPVEVFPISANMSEAFRIEVTDAGSTAYYENETTYGGDLNLSIEVFDWGLAHTSSVMDEIACLWIISDMIDPWFSWPPPLSDPGSTDCSRIFNISMHDVHPTGVDGQEVLIKVLSTHPQTYAPDIPGLPDFDYPIYAGLAAYTIYEAEISSVGPTENHPPEVGVIDGPDYLFQGEDGVYTLSYATDPEDGTDLTILWDNDGDLDFADDLDGDDSDLEATLNFPEKGYQYVIARAVDSGGLYTDSGPFEVFVEGCPTEVHCDFSAYHITDGTSGYYVHMDSAYQTVGEYAGYLLFQNKPGEIRAYDTTAPTPWTGEPYINLVDTYDNQDKLHSIDVCDHSGRVIISMMHVDPVLDPSLFYVYDVDGSYLASFSVGEYREVNAIDTDENGDIRIASWENWHDDDEDHEYDEGEGKTSQIQHFIFQEGAPYYISDADAEYDISDQFPANNQMWDLAVSYTMDRIYAVRATYSFPDPWAEYGELYSWDILPGGTIELNEVIQDLEVFPGPVMGSYTTFHGSLVGGDVEIDHSYETSEYCRLILMGKKKPAAGDWGHYFVVMDSDLNYENWVVVPGSTHRYSFAIKNDKYPYNREIHTPTYNNTNDLQIAPAPAGW